MKTYSIMNMKKWIIGWLLMLVVPSVWAIEGCKQQRLSREEFQAKQQAYITEKAALTPQEAEAFFPVYFELQDRKKALHDEAWDLIRKGKDERTTEAEYEEIMEGIYDSRMAIDRLDKLYFDKFKRILSCKKIYLVQKAEMRFHRELLREMKHRAREKNR